MKKEIPENIKIFRSRWNNLKTDNERIKFLVDEFSMSKKEAGEIVCKSWRDLPNEIKGYFMENVQMKHLMTFEAFTFRNEDDKKVYIFIYTNYKDDEMWGIKELGTDKVVSDEFYGQKEAENFIKENGWILVDKSKPKSSSGHYYSDRAIKFKSERGMPFRRR